MTRDGTVFGTGYESGRFCKGTVFKIAPGGEFSVLHTFSGSDRPEGRPIDGAYPMGRLTFGPDGAIYGTTADGGKDGNGTVFRLAQTSEGRWKYSIIHDWDYYLHSGRRPQAGLVIDRSGALYGTTRGFEDSGVMFKLTRNTRGTWDYEVLHYFGSEGQGGGYTPAGGLLLSGKIIYGATRRGGYVTRVGACYERCGTVFEFER